MSPPAWTLDTYKIIFALYFKITPEYSANKTSQVHVCKNVPKYVLDLTDSTVLSALARFFFDGGSKESDTPELLAADVPKLLTEYYIYPHDTSI